MKLIDKILRRSTLGLLSAATALGIGLSGCDSLIYDYEGDCDFRVRFVFDHHLHYSDAFATHVKAVTLYIIDDKTGEIVWHKSEAGPHVESANYRMRIDQDLPEGTYSFIAWCGEGVDQHFKVAKHLGEDVAPRHYSDLRCRLERGELDHLGRATVTDDIKGLYHGRRDNVVLINDMNRTQEIEVKLKKNTNDVNVLLQNIDGHPIGKDEFTFQIIDANGHMDWDNELLDDDTLVYSPHHVSAGEGIALPQDSRATLSQPVCMAEHTVGRMIKGHDMRLVILDSEGDTTASVPIIDYALMVKGSHMAQMDDQEFLDRQDMFNMTFFMVGDRWQSAQVNILSWRIVIQNSDL